MRTLGWAGPWHWLAAVGAACALGTGPVLAEGVKRCVDANGRITITNLACPVVQPPTVPPAEPPCRLTPEERRDAERQEQQFLRRFPTELDHRRATLGDLQPTAARIRASLGRFDDLTAQRKKIDVEREFFKNKPMPPELTRKLADSEGAFAGLAEAFRGAEFDMGVVMSRFWCDRHRFGALWQGAASGSSACAGACP